MTATGSLFGLAFGDACGAPTEFLPFDTIILRYGPEGPADLPDPARVTDDTQMALAVGEAVVEVMGNTPVPGRGGGKRGGAANAANSAIAGSDGANQRPHAADALAAKPLAAKALAAKPLKAEPFAAALTRHFVAWAKSPENNRAPGMTCLRACAGLAEGRPWRAATQPGSKGCGANMRVTPLGLVPDLSPSTRAGAAQLQAAMTHGHPTGLAASDLTCYATFWLNGGMEPDQLLEALIDRCDKQRENYHEAWLGDLWTRGHDGSATEYIARGWDECRAALKQVERALVAPDRQADPCLATGAGWIAEEALATALYCFLLFGDEPVTVVRRAAATSGESDSIAALAGAFVGARHGIEAFPAPWVERIEYADRLTALARAWEN